MIFVTLGYTVYMAYHYYKLKKQGGALIKEYTHKSSVKTVAYVLIVLGIFYFVMFMLEKNKNATKVFTMILFLYFIGIVAFISIQKIKRNTVKSMAIPSRNGMERSQKCTRNMLRSLKRDKGL